MTALHAVPEPSRPGRTRRIRFRVAESGPLPKHYVGDDIAFSHLVSLLPASFPAGEEAFIRAVQHYAPGITDPVLKERVKGFVGQEMTHGHAHRTLNDTLAAMGYPTRPVDNVLNQLEWIAKLVPPILPIALTAVAFDVYLRPGFHPDDVDTDAPLAEWQDRLFGPHGDLVGHLR